jgi:glycosyltransferase involved in cell wall biosynthesis
MAMGAPIGLVAGGVFIAVKILMVISPSRLGGAERFTGYLCRSLADAGNDVRVIVKRAGPVYDWYREINLDVRTLNIGGKLNVGAVFRLSREIRALQAEVIHTHLSTASLWGSLAAKLTGIPCVAHVHSLNSYRTYKRASRIIAASGAVKEHLVRQGASPSQIDVVLTGIGGYPENVTPASDISALGQKVIVCAAFLRKEKGVHVVLEALPHIHKRVPGTALAFVGEGPERAALAARAAEIGVEKYVHFAGFRKDMYQVFAAATVSVLPSIAKEGLGLVIAESFYAGTPAVGSNVGGIPELVDDGTNGLLVEPGNVEQLAGALTSILSDSQLRSKLAGNAKAKSTTLTVEESARGCLAAYRRAMMEGAPAST